MSKSNKMVNRRGFLKLAGMTTLAGTTAVALGGCAPTAKSNYRVPGGEISFETTTDVLIAGAGMSGLWAAYQLAKSGVKTLVVEKQPSWGGKSMMSCGCIYGRGTVVQQKYGISDSTPDEVWEQVKGRYVESKFPELHRMVVDYNPKLFEIWNELGAEWMDMNYPGWPLYFHVQKDGLGNLGKLMKPLYDYAIANGVEFRFETAANSLILDENNAVVGMRVKDEVSGEYSDIEAKKTILAVGDYVSNQELVSIYAPQALDKIVYTPIAMGCGIMMGLAAGAALKEGGVVALGPEFVSTTTTGIFDSVLNVYPDGTRCSDESKYHVPLNALKSLGFSHFWTIFDQTLREGHLKSTYEKRINMGGVITADSVEELAAKTLIPVDTLKATFEKFNGDAEKDGVDTEFNKLNGIKPLKPPFYAAQNIPVRYLATGGLTVNNELQVLDRADTPIPNLYAIGGTQGEVSINVHQVSCMGLRVGEVVAESLSA